MKNMMGSVPLAVVEGELSVLDEKTTVERKRVRLDVDVARLGVGREDTGSGTVGVEGELLHRLDGSLVVGSSSRSRGGGGLAAGLARLGGDRLALSGGLGGL